MASSTYYSTKEAFLPELVSISSTYDSIRGLDPGTIAGNSASSTFYTRQSLADPAAVVTAFELTDEASVPPPKTSAGPIYTSIVDQYIVNHASGPVYRNSVDQYIVNYAVGPVYKNVVDQVVLNDVAGPIYTSIVDQYIVDYSVGPVYKNLVDQVVPNDVAGPIWQEKIRGPLRPTTIIQFTEVAGANAIFTRPVSSTVQFNPVLDGFTVHMASAENAINFSLDDSRFKETFSIATSMLDFSTEDVLNTNLDVTADNTVQFSDVDAFFITGIPLSADNTIQFGSANSIVLNNEIIVSASSNFNLLDDALGVVPTIVIGASNLVQFDPVGEIGVLFLYVNAETEIQFNSELGRTRLVNADASTTVGLDPDAVVDMTMFVDGSNSFSFGTRAYHTVIKGPGRPRRFTNVKNISGGIIKLRLVVSRRQLTMVPGEVVRLEVPELDPIQISKLRNDFIISVDPF